MAKQSGGTFPVNYRANGGRIVNSEIDRAWKEQWRNWAAEGYPGEIDMTQARTPPNVEVGDDPTDENIEAWIALRLQVSVEKAHQIRLAVNREAKAGQRVNPTRLVRELQVPSQVIEWYVRDRKLISDWIATGQRPDVKPN